MSIYKYTATIVLCVILVVALTLVGVDFLATPYASADSELCRPWDDSFNSETADEIRSRYSAIEIKEYRRSDNNELTGYGFYYGGTFTITDEVLTVRNFYWTTTSVVFHREICHVGYILTDKDGKVVTIR